MKRKVNFENSFLKNFPNLKTGFFLLKCEFLYVSKIKKLKTRKAKILN